MKCGIETQALLTAAMSVTRNASCTRVAATFASSVSPCHVEMIYSSRLLNSALESEA
jgi:hypothetical protein